MGSPELLIPAADISVRRFAVAWRNRVKRSIHRVAVLDYDVGTYRFQYLSGVGTSVEGFRPFIGFPDLDRTYVSPRLWPFFDLRVMDRRRPDYAEFVRWLGLAPNASRLDILARSGGEQKGDTVLLAESPPVAPDGATATTFLARGSSYAVRLYDSVATVGRLRPGDKLRILHDASNETNPNARLIASPDGIPVGWVPDLLVEYASEVMTNWGTATLVQNNGTGAPWHMRLVVQVAGHVAPGSSSFVGGVWPPMSDGPSP